MNAELRSTFLQTDLMPDTWNTFESVQFVSTEIETYVRNYSFPSRISQLIRLQWIVIVPVLHEFQQKFLIFDSHVTANRKFGYIRSFFSSHCTFLWPWVPFWQRQRPYSTGPKSFSGTHFIFSSPVSSTQELTSITRSIDTHCPSTKQPKWKPSLKSPTSPPSVPKNGRSSICRNVPLYHIA